MGHGMTLVFHAQSVAQAETLFFQRAGDPQLTLVLGNQPAGEDAGLKERVDIADGEHLIAMVRAKNRDLLVA